MGVFDDKKFDQLDWISQATEPIDSRLNDVLAKIPDEITLDFDNYIKYQSSNDLNINTMVVQLAGDIAAAYLSWEESVTLSKMFAFEMEGEPIIDYNEKVIKNGTIKFIKLSSTLDEKTMRTFIGKEGIGQLYQMSFSDKGALSRANEIMEILEGCIDGINSKSGRKKAQIIKARMEKIFRNDEWRIRDTELANKISFWIKWYVTDGNIAAYSNFCKLKVMTHKQQAIYSIEEVE